METFEFAKYTEITDLVFRLKPEMRNEGYVRFFICPDVRDFWFVRILEGFNEDYEREEGSFLLERDKIPMNVKGEKLNINKTTIIIQKDEGENYDIEQGYDLEELIDNLDDGFGILNRKVKQV